MLFAAPFVAQMSLRFTPQSAESGRGEQKLVPAAGLNAGRRHLVAG